MTTTTPASWRIAYAALGCALAAVVALFWPTASSMVALWSDDPLAHGYLVVPGVLYLVWTRREQLQSFPPVPAWPAFPALALLAFVWLLGNLSGTSIIQQLALVGMIVGLVWGVLGNRALRTLLFPLAFLLFALPLGDRLIPALQDLTARFAVKMLDLTGVPVLLQGHVISIPGGSWQVAEACSGINYLMSSLAIGYLYAGTTYRQWPHRIGFVGASAIVPLLANGVRVYLTIFMASLGWTGIVAGTEHYLFGWIVFSVVMVLLFATCGNWREGPLEGTASSRAATLPVSRRWTPLAAALAAILLVGVAPLSARTLMRQSTDVPLGVGQDVTVSHPWTSRLQFAESWMPRFATPTLELVRSYESGRSPVKLYMAYYGADEPGVKLASATNTLYESPWWSVETARRPVTYQGQSFEVRETRLEAPASSLIVWHWYWVDGTFTSSDYVAKALLAKARLLRSRRGSAALAIATENRPGVEPAAILADFLAHTSIADVVSPVALRE